MGEAKEGCLKIQLLPRETFKFSAHDGLSPTRRLRLPAHRRGAPCPARDSVPVLDPPLPNWQESRPLAPLFGRLFMLESHECSSWESASGKSTGRNEVRAILSSLFLGSASRAARRGPRPAARGTRARGRGGGEGQLGGRGLTELLKMAALKANNIAHLPGKAGAAPGRQTGAPATQRNHGETFSARADGGAQGQRLGAHQPSAAQQPSGGERPPQVRSPPRCCGGSHFQEFPRSVRSSAARILPRSRPPRRRSSCASPRAVPRRSRACPSASFVWLRRAGLRRVELSPRRRRLARLGAAGLAAVAKRPEP